MKEQIKRFMEECPKAKAQPFGKNAFVHFVETDLPTSIFDTGLVDKVKYKIQAGAGTGNWAKVLWMCILDKSITVTPQKGEYIVYLLSNDCKRLYLTFNQGCNDISNSHSKKETIEILHKKAEKIRERISGQGFIADRNIDLGENLTNLGIFYREGTIFYKEYRIDSIPEESELRDDLNRMMSIYADFANNERPSHQTGQYDSWEIIDENTAVKHCDKSFFDHNGSGVPKEITWFFRAEQLDLGEKIPLSIQS